MPSASTGATPTDGRFRLDEVVEEARDLIKGTKRVFLGMGLIALAVFAAAGVLTRPFVGETPMMLFSPLGLLGLVLAAPLQAAFAAAGLHRAARRDVSIHLMVATSTEHPASCCSPSRAACSTECWCSRSATPSASSAPS